MTTAMLTPPPAMEEFEAPARPAAPGGWFTCNVLMAGPADDGHMFICLSDAAGKFPPRWFSAEPTIKREMLAAALTAISTNKQASACLSTTDEYGVIQRLYIIK